MKDADIGAGAKITVGWDVQMGNVYATDGTKIQASKNGSMQVTITQADGTKVSGGSELMPAGFSNKADCHGTTFAGGQVWINNDQVGALLKHSGFTATNSPKLGDVGIYSSGRDILHSVTVVGMDSNTGQPNLVYSKGGITAPAVLPPGPGRGAGWSDPNATLTWYSR
jgi:hypothetical protein